MAKDKNHHLVNRDGVWYFRTRKGRQVIRKVLCNSVIEARKMRDNLLKEMEEKGDIRKPIIENDKNPVFGEIAQEWVKIKTKELKSSTLYDYRNSMNYHILPKIGNTPIKSLNFLEVKKLFASLDCSGKRLKNVMIPVREVFRFAQLAGYIKQNPMDLIGSPKVTKPDIHPLSMEEVNEFLDNVHVQYRNFFVVAFFSGLRFGEQSALKWKNVDFKLGVIKVRETRVRGEEGRPKTKRSVRDITMLPPVIEAMRDQRKYTMGKSEYVFLNQYGRPVLPDSMNQHIWKTTLTKAKLADRRMYETRHTFATLMLDAGELPGWVQRMMGHETLQMIHERYYSYIKNYQRDDGKAFMDNVYNARKEEKAEEKEEEVIEKAAN